MNVFGLKNAVPNRLAAIMLVSLLTTNSAWAKFYNTGIYTPVTSAKFGQTISVNASIKSDTDVENVHVSIALHKISETGVIGTDSLYVQAFENQSFLANKAIGFKLSYLVADYVPTGNYAVVLKAGSTVGSGNYLTAKGTTGNYLIALEGKPMPTGPVAGVTFYNTAVYIPNPLVNAGASITIKNGIKATKDVPFTNVRLEIHKVLENGAIDPAVVFKHEINGVGFIANQGVSYTMSYAIPESAPSGKYVFNAFVVDSLFGTVYFKLNSISDKTSFTVKGNEVILPAFTRGINIMDMGMGGNRGTFDTHYTAPKLVGLQSLATAGMENVRISFKWERAQPVIGGDLDAVYMNRLIKILKDSKTANMKVILDMHNYARYVTAEGVTLTFGAVNGPTHAQYADAWSKIATYIKSDPEAYSALLAYDIMNEPYGIPSVNGLTPQKVWEGYAQVAVDAIRATGDNALIHVEGYSYSSATQFAKLHPLPFITDAQNNIVYHAHVYFDNDTSGSYKLTFEEETIQAKKQGHASVGARGVSRVKSFTDYCKLQKIKCFIGEFGWPNTYAVGAQAAADWNVAGEEILTFMDQERLPATMWATGTWLNEKDNLLNVYRIPGYSTRTFEAFSQAEVLERHLGRPEENQ